MVDVTAYLLLLNVFIAQQSGNTVRFGLYLARGDWGLALRHGFPIALFVLSVCASSLLAEVARRRGTRSSVTVLLFLELCLLLALFLIGLRLPPASVSGIPGWQYYLMVALATASMGLQTAALQSVGGEVVRTTYVTGMLTNLAVTVARIVINVHDRVRRGIRRNEHRGSRARLLAAVWSAYAAGAIAGVVMFERWGLRDLAVALGLLSLAAVVDWRYHPARSDARGNP
jgi:uncharacterized membrane protein YoaK (UPF0700 family)